MRDPETIATVLTAAETGHLVLSTLHTNDASQAVSRILDSFPQGNQPQIRQQLSLALLAVVAQQLVPGQAGGRYPVIELLMASSGIRSLICKGEVDHQLYSALSTGRNDGMISMEQSLAPRWFAAVEFIAMSRSRIVSVRKICFAIFIEMGAEQPVGRTVKFQLTRQALTTLSDVTSEPCITLRNVGCPIVDLTPYRNRDFSIGWRTLSVAASMRLHERHLESGLRQDDPDHRRFRQKLCTRPYN